MMEQDVLSVVATPKSPPVFWQSFGCELRELRYDLDLC